MRPRDTAVSAVSEPEKNAEKINSTITAPGVKRRVVSIGVVPRGLLEECSARIRRRAGLNGIHRHIVGDKSAADPLRQDESKSAVLRFFVMHHVAHERPRAGAWPGNVGDDGGQPDGAQMLFDLLRIAGGRQSKLCRQAKGERGSNPHAFAVKQAIRKTRGGFERVAKSVPKIEQRGHRLRARRARRYPLSSAGMRDDLRCRRIAFDQWQARSFPATQELRIAERPIFCNFQHSPRAVRVFRQRRQNANIKHHDARLVTGPQGSCLRHGSRSFRQLRNPPARAAVSEFPASRFRV